MRDFYLESPNFVKFQNVLNKIAKFGKSYPTFGWNNTWEKLKSGWGWGKQIDYIPQSNDNAPKRNIKNPNQQFQ